MRRTHISFLLSLPVFMLCSSFAYSQDFCVTDRDEYQTALTLSAENKEDDLIMVVEGADITSMRPQYETGYSLQIDVGYDFDCSEKIVAAPKMIRSVKRQASATEMPEPQISTSGPHPPSVKTFKSIAGEDENSLLSGTEKVLGVPAYMWRHGCGPTALGMLLGYWDMKGMVDLFPGSAAIQTESVSQGIASSGSSAFPGHYQDYSYPRDDRTNSILEDNSENYSDSHESDSLADFLHTSWSAEGLRYGWSRSSKIIPALRNYTAYRNNDYEVEYGGYYMFNNSLNWNVLTTEIDSNRPMIFLVDTSGDGHTDHFVTVVGYRTEPRPQYACLNTWDSAVHWYDFEEISVNTPWGIWGAWSYKPASENMTGSIEEFPEDTEMPIETPAQPQTTADASQHVETLQNDDTDQINIQQRQAILNIINTLLLKY